MFENYCSLISYCPFRGKQVWAFGAVGKCLKLFSMKLVTGIFPALKGLRSRNSQQKNYSTHFAIFGKIIISVYTLADTSSGSWFLYHRICPLFIFSLNLSTGSVQIWYEILKKSKYKHKKGSDLGKECFLLKIKSWKFYEIHKQIGMYLLLWFNC